MDNINQWLNERKIIYSILALFYHGEINRGLEVLRGSSLLETFAGYGDNNLLSEGARVVIKDLAEHRDDKEYEALISADYQRLFIGPDKILAPLWESVYKEKDRLLFGEVELKVRRFYESIGVYVKDSEPADSLSLELSFMTLLISKILENNSKNIKDYVIRQREFLKEHLISWISSWAEEVEKNAETNFWRGFSLLTRGYVENDLYEVEKIQI
ncbi:MAG: molecular chaperone [Clostridiaceae bacterium]